LAVGKLEEQAVLLEWADKLSATPSQIALAWMLKRSPAMLPIPGTSSVTHLEQNVSAGDIELSEEAFAEINEAYTNQIYTP
jgi:pyridoxine 4-dehydrogenase